MIAMSQAGLGTYSYLTSGQQDPPYGWVPVAAIMSGSLHMPSNQLYPCHSSSKRVPDYWFHLCGSAPPGRVLPDRDQVSFHPQSV